MRKVRENLGPWEAKWIRYNWGKALKEVYEALRNGASINEIIKRFGAKPDIDVTEGNVALNEGLQLLIDIITGLDTTSNKWDSDNAYIGVGDGSTAEDASQTGLQGSQTKYNPMDNGYPQRDGQTAKWRATFGGDEANFHWQEFTVANGEGNSAVNLNRKVADKGTKASGETWTLELQITFS